MASTRANRPVLDRAARRRLRQRHAIWHLVGAAAAAGAVTFRRWHLRWGATLAERQRILPGDDVVAQPRLEATRAIGIDAPPPEVWPWIVQIGQGRGGFYSYDWLENLLGLDIHSADRVLAEFQDLAVGDAIHLAEPVALEVAVLDPPRALVLTSPAEDAETQALPFSFSWAFVLEPEGPTGSRLVIRERYSWSKVPIGLVIEAVEHVSFAMTQKMMHGIKDRAEGASGL